MELTVQNVYGLLLRSKLMPADEAQKMLQRWQSEAGDATANLSSFLKWVVSRQYLTEYQAGLLGRGHAEGFFLNQYKILERLGKGRMAGVYKAVHPLGQVVAIKVLPPSRAKDPQFLGRFQREARLAARLNHPNIVRVFQVGQSGDLNYFVMEYIEGETLEEVLKRRGKLSPTEAVRLVYLALLGLQHIHERGMIHRDLKPANLMLSPAPEPGSRETTQRSQVKILDIGLARTQGDAGADLNGGQSPEAMDLTTEGALLGTPDYMAPEQARDARAADIRSDIYSLGCVLYHTLAGQPPFPDTNLISQMVRHATEQPKPLREFNPAVPDGLQQILNWMMAKDPNQRYPTPARAAQALQVYLAAGTVDAPAVAQLDKNMKTYLDWIEVENSKDGLEPLPAAAPPKFAPAAPARERRPQAPAPRKERRGKRAPAPPPEAERVVTATEALDVDVVPTGPRTPTPEFDVDVVPAAPPPPKRQEKPNPFHLTPRDFIMFGIGVGGTLITVIIAVALVKLLTNKPTPSGGPDRPPEQTAPVDQ